MTSENNHLFMGNDFGMESDQFGKKEENRKEDEYKRRAANNLNNAVKFLLKQGTKENPLDVMPSKEEMKRGLEDLFDAGVASYLSEANPEKGRPFHVLELNFKGDSSYRDNDFIKGFAILREKMFRKTGEGTGNSMDWAEMDEYVRQTITWDPEENTVVSASRMAVPAETIEKPTFFKNLYETNESFEKNIMEKSAELGRTFLNFEYLGNLRVTKQIKKLRPATNSLFSGVWQQFDTALKEGHKLKYMHGAVSIDGRYSDISLRRYAALYTYFFPEKDVVNDGDVKPKEDENLILGKIDDFKKGEWFVEGDFAQSEKNLKKFLSQEAQDSGAKYPELLGRYPGFVGNKNGAVVYFLPVKNPSRDNCVEIGLLLDASQFSFEIEQQYSLKGKDLTEEESISARVKSL